MDRTPQAHPDEHGLTAERVAREYGHRIRAVAFLAVGNHHDAEDVAQEVLLKVVLHLGTFRGEGHVLSWLHAVTVYTARDFRRRQSTRAFPAADPGAIDALASRGDAGGPMGRVLSREAQVRFDQAVAGLPAVYRDSYTVADLEQRPYREAGALLGVDPATVKTRVFRARAILREVLAPYFQHMAA